MFPPPPRCIFVWCTSSRAQSLRTIIQLGEKDIPEVVGVGEAVLQVVVIGVVLVIVEVVVVAVIGAVVVRVEVGVEVLVTRKVSHRVEVKTLTPHTTITTPGKTYKTNHHPQNINMYTSPYISICPLKPYSP